MTKVKICGITNYEDAANAAILGADYIGFNFYKSSPRYIDESEVKKIIERMPNSVKKVGVFVNEKLDAVKRIVKDLNLDLIQLHGGETPEYCKQIKKETKKGIIKSFRIKDKSDIEKIKEYNVDYYLFDAYKEGLFGGTGKTFDHSLLKNIKRKFFLSGGLNEKNVKEAIKTTKPFAVDTASGVEKNPRKKDPKKMEEFIKAAK
jgi:phosphoribosylanthranilate isomerase